MIKLHIKYMTDDSSKEFVVNELTKIGLNIINIDFCEVSVMERISLFQISKIKKVLREKGLELVLDKRTIIVENIKSIIKDMLNNRENIRVNFSTFLSSKLKRDYTYLSNIFSDIEGETIEQFIIYNKIEMVKTFIILGELNISEISYLMKYSSTAHLCNQFKKVTGMTTSAFKKNVEQSRISSRVDINVCVSCESSTKDLKVEDYLKGFTYNDVMFIPSNSEYYGNGTIQNGNDVKNVIFYNSNYLFCNSQGLIETIEPIQTNNK